ncbi:MAG: AAA family ATPase [Thiomonas sp.]
MEVVRRDGAAGASHTELVTLKVAGDPQLHTHVAVPNVVLTPSGRVGSLDLQQLEGRVHEWGALYQAYLAHNLRRAGIGTELDPERGSARITIIPEALRQAFSKRTERGVDAARRYARDAGLDWDALSPEQQIGLAKRGVQGDPRQAKQDDLSDRQAWWKQARALGWRARSVITQPGEVNEALTPMPFPAPIAVSGAGIKEGLHRDGKVVSEAVYPALRIIIAYYAALPLLERDLKRRAVIDESVARVAAARGLIESGIADETDVDAVMTLFFEAGVRQDGQMVRLIRGEAHAGPRSRVRLTTTMHAAREAELIDLARRAARNRRDVLRETDLAVGIAQAFGKYATTEQGKAQAELALHLGTSGRFAVGIGVAGSGKSTVLAPLVTAWKAERRRVYGAALAWRQSDDLEAAGIASEDRAALSVLLDRIRSGQIMLDRDSVIVVDELGLIGTRQMLELLRLRAESDCTLVAIGDPLQCQSIEAGPVIDLLRKALGPKAVPELLSSVRQHTESERETALLFRSGYADLALGRLRAEDRAMMVPGGYQQAVEAVADLWQHQRARHANEVGYTLSVTAPRNADARAIAVAIRERRRAAGEIGADAVVVPACDQMDDQYDLRLAIGDRVRLFARTTARFADGGHGVIGNNGSVLEVTGVDADGLRLRRGTGREGMIAWDRLRDPVHGRVRLTYGDVLTIDAAQGSTGTEHILAMPGGSGTVNGFKAYVSASRHRVASFMVTSEGAERGAVMARRPLGDPRPIGLSDLWAHMAENLSRQVMPESATSFLERACRVQTGAVRALHAGFQPIEQREAARQDPTTLVQTWRRNRLTPFFQDLTDAYRVVTDMRGALQEVGRVIRCLSSDVIAAATPLIDQAVRRFRRRPSQISKSADLERLRQRWVDRQMKLWLDEDLEARPAPYWGSPEFDRARIAREKREAEAKARYEREVKLLSRKALRDFASDLDLIERAEAQMEKMRQENQRYRPGPRMGM